MLPHPRLLSFLSGKGRFRWGGLAKNVKALVALVLFVGAVFGGMWLALQL